MKILITGANGFLGQALVKQLLLENYYVLATGRGPCRLSLQETGKLQYHSIDILDAHAIGYLFENESPDLVIHAAAMTQVDECELNKEISLHTNVNGTRNLIKAAENIGSRFIYVSTDFVFDGLAGPYTETDAVQPINWYGTTKVMAEQLLRQSALSWSIVRTCLVYGESIPGTRPNFISWVRENLEKGRSIKVVGDQYRTPTFLIDLVRGICLVLSKNAGGIFHISGEEIMTPYEMALAAAGKFGLAKSLIEKVCSTEFTQPGKRPPRTGFNIAKAKSILNFEPVPFLDNIGALFVK